MQTIVHFGFVSRSFDVFDLNGIADNFLLGLLVLGIHIFADVPDYIDFNRRILLRQRRKPIKTSNNRRNDTFALNGGGSRIFQIYAGIVTFHRILPA